jgi:hypothetical protein
LDTDENATPAISPTIIDAAGDLIIGTAADTVGRLPIGTAGQVLQVNSGATAPEWANAGGSGANYTLLNSGGTSLTGATTITVSGISNKERLLVLVVGASSANASSEMSIRFNADTGANYSYRGFQITAGATYDAANFEPSGASTDTSYAFAKMANNAASFVGGSLLIEGCKSTGFKNVSAVASGNANTNTHLLRTTQGLYLGTSAITSVSIVSSTGNFDAGTIFVYGSDN